MSNQILDFIIHLDRYLDVLIQTYGPLIYGILFIIIFAETGLVATPFLPGDSLLFAVGTFAARGVIDVHLLIVLLTAAAILGDTVNYWIGNKLGRRAFSGKYRFFNKEHLLKTEKFYEKYGSFTIVIARFVPIVRTFAPFIAGIGSMYYPKFLFYNVFGAILWVIIFVVGGYFFGNLPWVRTNFSLVIMAIILLSIAPVIVTYLRQRVLYNQKIRQKSP